MFFIKGGYYVFNLLEVYAAGVSLLTTVFFEGNFKLYTATEELYSCKIEYLVKKHLIKKGARSFCNFSWILGYFTVHVNLEYDKVESKRSNTAAE